MTAPASAVPRPGRALAVLCGVLALTFLDTTVISVALGSVQSHLHAGVLALQWVVDAYSLVFASLMITAGTLGDRLGRKRIMVAGLIVFCLGSLMGAVATSAGVLIGARALMGAGAAASEPGTLSVIRHLYPDPAARSRALGVWAGVSGLALALGPVVGGVLVGIGDWRWVFWFNLLAGLLLAWCVTRVVPETADRRSGKQDVPGFLLSAGFLSSGIFAVISGEDAGYRAGWIVFLFVLCGLCLAGFIVVETRTSNPMVEFKYFRDRRVGGALGVAFAIYFGVFSIFLFTALYLEEVVGYSGFKTAGQFALMAVAMVLGSIWTGRWVAASGPRGAMTTGCLLAGVGILLTEQALVGGHEFWWMSLTLACAGAGFGIAVVPVTSAVLGAIPAEHSGMAASATNTVRQIGAVVGVAVLGSLVNAHLTAGLTGKLNALGIPANFDSIVIGAIEQGGVSGSEGQSASQTYGPIVDHVINAAYSAFKDGLTVALIFSAILVFIAGAVAFVTNAGPSGSIGTDPDPDLEFSAG